MPQPVIHPLDPVYAESPRTWERSTAIPGWYRPEFEMRVIVHEQQHEEGGETITAIEVAENPESLSLADQRESIRNYFSAHFGKLFTPDPEIITQPCSASLFERLAIITKP